MNKERRFHRGIELRAASDGAPVIFGYAAKFNSMSDMGGYFEVIQPGAFSNILASPDIQQCKALFNHDENYVLGAVKNSTLLLKQDDTGLYYEAQTDPANEIVQNMVVAPLKRGDIDGSSFCFFVENADWSEVFQGQSVRRITSYSMLFDVGPVTYPAFPAADANVRALMNAPTLEEIEALKKVETGEEWLGIDIERRRRELRMKQFKLFNP